MSPTDLPPGGQTRTRAEHVDWCKRRALEYLPFDPTRAFTSLCCDLGTHPETREHVGIQLGMTMLLTGGLKLPGEMQRFIEGFH